MTLALEALLKYVTPGCTFVDIGAHQGEWSIAFQKAGAIVYSIEPLQGNVYALLKNIRKECPVERPGVFAYAISKETGVASLYTASVSTIASLDKDWIPSVFPEYESGLHITVRTKSWGDFCRDARIQSVDICKIDVEGYDAVVLESVFSSGPVPNVICIEVGRDTEERIVRLMEQNSMARKDLFWLDGERGFYDAIYEKGP